MKPGAGPMNIVAVRRGPGRHMQVTTDVVMDLMIHDIGLALQWIGAKPEIVSASGEQGQYSAIDGARAVLSFPGGSSALLIAKRDDAGLPAPSCDSRESPFSYRLLGETNRRARRCGSRIRRGRTRSADRCIPHCSPRALGAGSIGRIGAQCP